MINFDSKKLRCEYVRVKKITSTYLYITTTMNGNVFKNKTASSGTYKGLSVQKLRIHKTVSNDYFKHNVMSEFKDKGRYACIAFYDDIVLSFDIQSFSFALNTQKEWRSPLDSILAGVNDIIPDKNVYINGQEILWFQSETAPLIPATLDSSFYLRPVKYLSLSKIGVNVINKDNAKDDEKDDEKDDAKDDVKDDVQDDANLMLDSYEVIGSIGFSTNLDSNKIGTLDFGINFTDKSLNVSVSSVAFVRSSHVLCYYPNGLTDPDLFVISPILYDTSNSKGTSESSNLFNRTTNYLQNIDSKSNRTFLNMQFVLLAGRSIGEKYGYEEVEILNVEDLIMNTKTISLNKISLQSRQKYPIDLHPLVGLSWLFKFFHNEKDLNTMRDLSVLFTRIMSSCFIEERKISQMFKAGKSESDILIRKYNSIFKPVNVDVA